MGTLRLVREDERPDGASRGPRSSRHRGTVDERDLRMMRRAIELAERAAAEGEVPVGAVVYRGDEIIAEGWNLREATNDPTAHAELLAMRQAGIAIGEWRLNDCTLAVTLEPCPMCSGAMVNARLGRVIYGASDPKAGACDTLYEIPTDRRLNHEVTVIGGVMAEECGDLLRTFFRRRRAENKAKRAGRGAGSGSGGSGGNAGNGGASNGGAKSPDVRPGGLADRMLRKQSSRGGRPQSGRGHGGGGCGCRRTA